MCRNPKHTKYSHYQRLKPSKCQLKLCVETVTPQVETNSQADPQPSKPKANTHPRSLTTDNMIKPTHSVNDSANELKRLSDSKGVKKRKSASPFKEKKRIMVEDKQEEKKVPKEANKNGEEETEEAEDNALQCSAVTNGKRSN